MGMFDRIIGDFNCPYCNAEFKELQTKQLTNCLDECKIGDDIYINGFKISTGEFEVHSYCNKCNNTIEGVGIIEEGKLIDIIYTIDVL